MRYLQKIKSSRGENQRIKTEVQTDLKKKRDFKKRNIMKLIIRLPQNYKKAGNKDRY